MATDESHERDGPALRGEQGGALPRRRGNLSRAPIGWYGGKAHLAERLAAMLRAITPTSRRSAAPPRCCSPSNA